MAVPDYTKKQLARYLEPGATPLNAPLDLRNLSEFGKGFEAFKDESVGIGGGVLALGAQQLQKVLPAAAQPTLEKITAGGLETFEEKMQEATAGAQAPAVPRIEDIKGFGSFADWAAFQAGKGLPQMAGLGIGGIVGRGLASFGVKKGLKHVVKTETGKKLLGQEVTQEVKDEAANQIRKTLNRGTIAGGFLTAAPYEGGAAFGELVGEGVSPEEAAGPATAVAGISGALEFAPLYQVAKRLGMGEFAQQGIRELIKKDGALGKVAVELAKRASGAAAVGATAEGVTEGLQELTNIAALRWAKDQDLYSSLSDEDWSRIANATAAGGLLGGGVAGGAGAFIGPRGVGLEPGEPVTPPTTPTGEPSPRPAPSPIPTEPVVEPVEPAPFVGPEIPAEERRKSAAVRKAVDEMSPEEQTEAIKYLREERALSQATGISNKLAWNERKVQPFMAAIDVDSLKWINDNLGHEAGDALLKKTAQALQEATGEAYHFSGDEFWVQGDSVAEISQKMTAAQEALQQQEVGGFAPTFSYGIGTDISTAETAMQADKDAREAAGKRAARGETPPTKVAPVEAPPVVEPTPVAPAPTPAPAPVAPIEIIEPGPTPPPDYSTGLREGWQPEGARQYAERYGAVLSEQDPLSSDPTIDRLEASNIALPEQVARKDPAAARKLSAEIRRNPGQFAAWSGMHPDFANKVANDLERAAQRVEERGDLARPKPEEVTDFGEVTTNAQGRPFASRKAALIASQKLGMENVEIDERVADGETNYVIRDLGPGAAPLESAATKAPVPEVVGDVQMPVNLVEESVVPPSAKITMTRKQGRREVTKQVNARKAVALSKRRVSALREMIECLS